MTYEDWKRDTALAPKLKEALSLPIIQQALSVVNDMTAAKVLGNTTAITTHAGNASVLFGFDAGRASVIRDLNDLTIAHEEIEEIQPSYTTEF
jgi:hypothetical protein